MGVFPMNDVELVASAMREIEIILSEHIEPDRVQDADRAINRIFEAIDRPGVQAAVRRLRGEKAPLRLFSGDWRETKKPATGSTGAG